MDSFEGAAVVNGSTAYFSKCHDVYSYTVHENKWTELPECKYRYFAMAVINDALTTIVGRVRQGADTNTLLSLSGSTWEEVLPPMPTKRKHPTVANTPTHLVVAAGCHYNFMATVEVLNTETLQWSTASSLPEVVGSPRLTTCGGCIYLASGNNDVFSCSMADLLKSTNSSDGGSVWTRLASIPTPCESSLATLRGHVLAIGGADTPYGGKPTGDIHCYNVATDSWRLVAGEIPTPRFQVLTAVLPSNELVVVGGYDASGIRTKTSDIGIYSSSQLTSSH